MWLHKSLSLFLHDRKKVENIEENEEGNDKEKGKEETSTRLIRLGFARTFHYSS